MLLAVLAGTLAAGLAESLPKPMQRGRVLDAGTDTPLAGVRILAIYEGAPGDRFRNVDPGVAETVTDSLGRYSLSMWGNAWVLFRAPDHKSLRLVFPDGLVECDSCCGQLKDVKLTRYR